MVAESHQWFRRLKNTQKLAYLRKFFLVWYQPDWCQGRAENACAALYHYANNELQAIWAVFMVLNRPTEYLFLIYTGFGQTYWGGLTG